MLLSLPSTIPLTLWTPLVHERGQLAGVYSLDEAVSNVLRQGVTDKSAGNKLLEQRERVALQSWTAAEKLVEGFALPHDFPNAQEMQAYPAPKSVRAENELLGLYLHGWGRMANGDARGRHHDPV